MDLSGNMTRQIEQDMPVQDDTSHIVNVGKLVEDMELKMRNLLRVYTGMLQMTHADSFQRRCISAKQRMLWEIFEVSRYWPLLLWPRINNIVGIPPLTEANKEKATHQEMINSMKR